MPTEIRLSQISDRAAFEQDVAQHVTRLTEFNSIVGKPRPVAHPLVEAAITRYSYPKAEKKPDEYKADYVLIDDTPPPPPPLNLADRKNILSAKLRAAEAVAREKILPALKNRLFNVKVSAALAVPEADRTDADKALIEELKYKQEQFQKLELVAAEAEAALEDVTEDSIDSWQLPNFG